MTSKPINKEGRLKVLSWNIGSAHANLHHLKVIITTHEPHIILLQEGICAHDKSNRKLNLTGYQQIRSTAQRKNHILITYYKKGIQVSHLPNDDAKHSLDTIKISIKHVKATYTITNVYNPPRNLLDTDTLEQIITNNTNNIIAGDFNMNVSDSGTNTLDEVINNHNLQTCNKNDEITRVNANTDNHTIDHILHEPALDNDLINFKILEGFGTLRNYHKPILANYRLHINHEPVPTRHSRNLDQKIYREATKKARENHSPPTNIINKEDIDTEAQRINTIINEAYDEALPKKIPKNKKSTHWAPSAYLKHLYNRKEKAEHDYAKYRDQPEAAYFELVRETICEEIKDQTEKEIEKNFTKAINKIKQHPKNGRLYHKEIKKLSGLSTRTDHACTLNYNGKTAHSAQAKAELHLKYQETVFTENRAANPTVERRFAELKRDNEQFLNDENESEFEPIDLDELQCILGTTDGHKAAGPDDIPAICYKWATKELQQDIVNLFNASIRLRHEPAHWKEAIIILIPKEGKDHSDPSGYRPISLLNTIAKALEKIMAQRITRVVEDATNEDGTPFLPDIQSGFRQGKQTNDHLFRVWNLMCKTTHRKNLSAILISLDLEKAFDKIPHAVILAPLIQLARDNPDFSYLAHFVAEFLTNRTFRVRIDDQISKNIGRILAGVPQGSSTGPIAFNIATARAPEPAKKYGDLHPTITENWGKDEKAYFRRKNRLRGEASTFADDQAYTTAINLNGHTDYHVPLGELHSHLKKTEEFTINNKMKHNTAKTGLLITTSKVFHHDPEIKFNGQVIKKKKYVKYLGLEFEENMTMNKQTEKTFRKCRSKIGSIGWMARNSNLEPKEIMSIMQTHAFSIAQYGSITWIGNPKHEKKMNSLYDYARRKACRAASWERTETLRKRIPDPELTITEKCKAINKKWYEKNIDTPAIVDNISNCSRLGTYRPERLITTRHRRLKKTPLYHLTT